MVIRNIKEGSNGEMEQRTTPVMLKKIEMMMSSRTATMMSKGTTLLTIKKTAPMMSSRTEKRTSKRTTLLTKEKKRRYCKVKRTAESDIDDVGQ